ncbi:outer membrane beta-barrel protein [Reichenbachiella agarivorans]|uniref:Outer membrane beta-barrel protein n=1 Tax=Reichenbachiella agarivorans TaxID=2979464 RepID=A0ABY6CRP6_9BACT|nr:outer membrane beta-barrel protein [Reichenbachiella agarivorans]UXP33187.1 outer membrane beta-barrel protein [Reichenbachiella agarivorans]
MKKLLTLAVILFAANTMYAQQGSMYAGGALGFQEDYWKIAPEAGYWLADNIQLGVVLFLEGDNRGATEQTTVAPHVYGRYWVPISEKFSVYAGANFRVNTVSQDPGDSHTTVDLFVDAGIAYSLAPRWGMVGRLAGVGIYDSHFVLDVNMSPQSIFNVGIYYTFKE